VIGERRTVGSVSMCESCTTGPGDTKAIGCELGNVSGTAKDVSECSRS
jgi:hypothetical protein